MSLGCPCPICKPPGWKTRAQVEEERRRAEMATERRQWQALEDLVRMSPGALDAARQPVRK